MSPLVGERAKQIRFSERVAPGAIDSIEQGSSEPARAWGQLIQLPQLPKFANEILGDAFRVPRIRVLRPHRANLIGATAAIGVADEPICAFEQRCHGSLPAWRFAFYAM